MNRIPFDAYDFFGYLASGLAVVIGMELTLGFPLVLGRDLKVADLAALTLGVYVAGQAIATPAKAVLEDFLVDKVLGRPSMNLFRKQNPRLRGFLFPGFSKALPEAVQRRVTDRAEAEGIRGTGEALFLHVRYHPDILKDENLMRKLDGFVNKYGFNRNLAFTSLLVGLALLVKAHFTASPGAMRYALTSLAASVLLFYRYLKFFHQYSFEMFNVYGGQAGPPKRNGD